MSLRRLPYGANYLDLSEMKDLKEALKEKILFRYTTERQSSSDLFEQAIMNKFNVNYALATTSCTQSLRLALMATRPKVGDKVYIPAMTFVAVAGAVLSCGLIPVLTDVDDNYSLDSSKLPLDAERVIITHMDGFVGSVPENVKYVIEDTAQSMGARHPDGVYAGAKGCMGAFSFHHAKILSSGEGGLITTNDEALFQNMRDYHDHGSNRKHGEYPTWKEDTCFGENMVAGEAQTSIQLQQFCHIEEITQGLDRGYKILRDMISENAKYEIIERKEFDQKTSLILRFESISLQEKVLKTMRNKTLPYWTFDRYFLPDHPILKEKNSLYADGFPWSLVDDVEALWNRGSFDVTKNKISRTLCLPISAEQPENVQIEEAKAFSRALKIALGE